MFYIFTTMAASLFIIWLFFHFESEPMLTGFVDWIKSWGWVVITVILGLDGVVIAWILNRKYYWQTPQFVEHEKLLVGNIHQMDNVQAVPYKELSLINCWKKMYDSLSYEGWTVKFNKTIIVESCLENSDVWDFLKSHLKNSKLQVLLSEWKSTTERDLIARKSLFDSIANKVRESTKIPIVEYVYGKAYPKPYITDYYVAVIYDAVFCALAGHPIRDTKDYLRHGEQGRQEEIIWYYGANTWLLLAIDDKEQQDDAVNLLLKLASDSTNLFEAQKAKGLYFNVKNREH
jgi:hypothetical protein